MSLWGDLVKANKENREKRGKTGENEMISELGLVIYRGGNRCIDKPEKMRRLREFTRKLGDAAAVLLGFFFFVGIQASVRLRIENVPIPKG
jgi:hypothetical protein